MKFRPFAEAREFVRALKLKNQEEWRRYYKSTTRPSGIPTNPDKVYRTEWKGWGDFLGTGRIASQDMKFLSFDRAKEIVHSLGLKTQTEWKEYCKSAKRPKDIPSNPGGTYRTEWKGWGDWLGTGSIADQYKTYRNFNAARSYIRSLGLKSQNEWREFVRSGKKPCDIPSNAPRTYKKEWKGMGDWLGTGTVASYDKKFRSFSDARNFAHNTGLKSQSEWRKFCTSGERPADIPSNPSDIYRNEWISWGDFLGTGRVNFKDQEHRQFEKAKSFVRSLKLKSREEWLKYVTSGQKPSDIPADPYKLYKKEWISWGDFLGTGTIAPSDRQFIPFCAARDFVHGLKLNSMTEWIRYCKSNQRPIAIPSNPNQVYEKDWISWGDWLGTDNLAPKDREYYPFEQVKNLVQKLGLKSQREWYNYSKTERPAFIPSDPSKVYEKEWKGWGDFLGTGTIAPFNIEFRPFKEAREFAHSLQLKGQEEWKEYCKSKRRPIDIPSDPPRAYKDVWEGWPDWLGYEEKIWSVNKVKELIRSLVESKIIYQWDEAVLYSFLLRRGLLNLDSNRHQQFFRNLIQASRTDDGLKAIEGYANSDSEIPPDLTIFEQNNEQEQEIESASPLELSNLVENADPLDYGEIKTADQILAQTNVLGSINVDEEAIQFYIDYSIDELWKSAFNNEENAVMIVKREGKNGNKYHDIVVESFLSDYEGTHNIKIPDGYAFPKAPTLMQRYVAYKVKNSPYFGNFSGTGAGKTLSAVLASRVIDSKMTLIICPNDVVDQWKKSIRDDIFPDSQVITGKEAFYKKYDDNKHQYLVLNYDKFSQEDSPNLILNLAKEKVDFVVLDEIHFVKKRDEESSQRNGMKNQVKDAETWMVL